MQNITELERRVAQLEAFVHGRYVDKKRIIIDMRVGEIGYTVSWAVGKWRGSYPKASDGLNLQYSVHPKPWGTVDTLICCVGAGWVVNGELFKGPR